MKNTLEIDGFTVTIEQDEFAQNPFTEWDCEPPLLVYSCDRHARLATYGDAPESLAGFVRLMPEECFARGKRASLLREVLPFVDVRGLVRYTREWKCSLKTALIDCLGAYEENKPDGWRSADEWFERAGALLNLAGIPCHYTESHGYSQGDTVKLLAIATPEWRELVGAPLDSCARQCEVACELYGQWAWGDVYGIASIESPDGEELDDGSVWGFYGSDHEKSGLAESARNTIECHKARVSRVRSIASRMCLA